jgi:hypothetical protein
LARTCSPGIFPRRSRISPPCKICSRKTPPQPRRATALSLKHSANSPKIFSPAIFRRPSRISRPSKRTSRINQPRARLSRPKRTIIIMAEAARVSSASYSNSSAPRCSPAISPPRNRLTARWRNNSSNPHRRLEHRRTRQPLLVRAAFPSVSDFTCAFCPLIESGRLRPSV